VRVHAFTHARARAWRPTADICHGDNTTCAITAQSHVLDITRADVLCGIGVGAGVLGGVVLVGAAWSFVVFRLRRRGEMHDQAARNMQEIARRGRRSAAPPSTPAGARV